jgi:hypothetical protein
MHKLVAGMAAGLALAALALPAAASAERVTPKTKLTRNGLGPIKIGMTLKEARDATGQNIKVIGHSQSAVIASVEMRGLKPNLHFDRGQLSFVLLGEPNRPNGGLLSRFPDLRLPFLKHTFGPDLHSAPSTAVPGAFDYWNAASFPRYPLHKLVYTFRHGDLVLISGGELPASLYPRVT